MVVVYLGTAAFFSGRAGFLFLKGLAGIVDLEYILGPFTFPAGY